MTEAEAAAVRAEAAHSGARQALDFARKPLAEYRREELEEMRRNFWGSDRSYHTARSAFVRKRALKSVLMMDSTADGGSNAHRLAYATTGWSSTITPRSQYDR